MNKESIKILNLISVNRRTVCGETYCPLSQKEMATASDLTYAKVNKIIKDLSNADLVQKMPNSSRKYVVTERGKGTLRRLK